MKHLTLFILAVVLFVGLTFAGKSFFGMDHHMQMGSLECVNHCIDSTVLPGVMSSTLSVLLFAVCVIVYTSMRSERVFQFMTNVIGLRRLTESIRLFLLSKKLSSVIIQD